MSEYHRTFCSTCKDMTPHEDGKCIRHEEETGGKVTAKDPMCMVTEMNDGTFSMDIWFYSKCIGDRKIARESMTYFDKLKLEDLERIHAELGQYLFDRMIKNGGMS